MICCLTPYSAILALLLTGCQAGGDGTSADTDDASTRSARTLSAPRGSSLGNDGFATVLRVPATPFRASAPDALDRADSRRPVESWLRFLPRYPRPDRPVIDIGNTGRLVLADGCLQLQRLDGVGRADLVALPADAKLALDREGYIVIGRRFGSDAAEWTRIGEPARWGGVTQKIDTPDLVERARAACGNGDLLAIAMPSSIGLVSPSSSVPPANPPPPSS